MIFLLIYLITDFESLPVDDNYHTGHLEPGKDKSYLFYNLQDTAFVIVALNDTNISFIINDDKSVSYSTSERNDNYICYTILTSNNANITKDSFNVLTIKNNNDTEAGFVIKNVHAEVPYTLSLLYAGFVMFLLCIVIVYTFSSLCGFLRVGYIRNAFYSYNEPLNLYNE